MGSSIQELEGGERWRVGPLFSNLAQDQPMCRAVLDEIWPGRVWANDAADPTSALLVTFLGGGGAAWCFLAGDPGDQAFNAAVNDALFTSQVAGEDVGMFLVTCDPERWGGHQADVGRPREPAVLSRRRYSCGSMSADWRAVLREPYSLHAMAAELLDRKDLAMPSTVRQTLETWRAVDDDRFSDFGVVACHENKVVAWATVDFVSSGAGDLGFETLPEHRGRGLGTAVAGAVLDRACKTGLTVHWTCAEDNTGSRRTAEKLGLERGRDYVMYLYVRDEHAHLAQVAYSKLSSGDARGALERFESLFEMQAEVPAWAYHDAAQACGALGNRGKAMLFLRQAAEEGWSAADVTLQTAEFADMRDDPEWLAVIERMRRNATG